jgi:hypothetical protein
MIEYIIISGILMVLLVITTLTLTNVLIDRPTDQLSEFAFIDIGNGVSTRIVDLYVIAPIRGNVTTDFDIPDEVAGKEYFVTVSNSPSGDYVRVYRGQLHRDVSLAGIGATLGVGGSTTGHGMNRISYRSEGYT